MLTNNRRYKLGSRIRATHLYRGPVEKQEIRSARVAGVQKANTMAGKNLGAESTANAASANDSSGYGSLRNSGQRLLMGRSPTMRHKDFHI